MLSLRSVYNSLSNACLKPTFLLLQCMLKKNLNVSDSNHAISREPVRFNATMPSKMATQASWICEKKGRCSMKSARREMGWKSVRLPPKSVELRCIRTHLTTVKWYTYLLYSNKDNYS